MNPERIELKRDIMVKNETLYKSIDNSITPFAARIISST